jgi:hypothetical protein
MLACVHVRALRWRARERNQQQSEQRGAGQQRPGFVGTERKRRLLDHGAKIGLDGSVGYIRGPVREQPQIKPDRPCRRDVAGDQSVAQSFGVSAGAPIEDGID